MYDLLEKCIYFSINFIDFIRMKPKWKAPTSTNIDFHLYFQIESNMIACDRLTIPLWTTWNSNWFKIKKDNCYHDHIYIYFLINSYIILEWKIKSSYLILEGEDWKFQTKTKTTKITSNLTGNGNPCFLSVYHSEM